MSLAPDFDPMGSDSPLIVYIDVKSPFAFVAKDYTYALQDELGLEFDWRPLTLDIPSYLGSARLDKKGKVAESSRSPKQWTQVRYAYRDARRYANIMGLTLRGTEKIWDTSLVHIGMLWVKRQDSPLLRRYLDVVYERFWRRELDVEQPEVVAGVLREVGASVDGFETFSTGDGRTQHDAMQAQIFAAGIFGVPGYILDGEYYFGREHLPSVRWHLSGKRGPTPDIAYSPLAPDLGT